MTKLDAVIAAAGEKLLAAGWTGFHLGGWEDRLGDYSLYIIPWELEKKHSHLHLIQNQRVISSLDLVQHSQRGICIHTWAYFLTLSLSVDFALFC